MAISARKSRSRRRFRAGHRPARFVALNGAAYRYRVHTRRFEERHVGASGHVQVHATQIERTLECTLSRSPSGSPAAACPHVARRQDRSTDTGPILGPNRLFDYITFLSFSSLLFLFLSFLFFFLCLLLAFPESRWADKNSSSSSLSNPIRGRRIN